MHISIFHLWQFMLPQNISYNLIFTFSMICNHSTKNENCHVLILCLILLNFKVVDVVNTSDNPCIVSSWIAEESKSKSSRVYFKLVKQLFLSLTYVKTNIKTLARWINIEVSFKPHKKKFWLCKIFPYIAFKVYCKPDLQIYLLSIAILRINENVKYLWNIKFSIFLTYFFEIVFRIFWHKSIQKLPSIISYI